ncbi:MAG: HAMP domain-containing histidine kinase [Acidimicrobiia bacterium]|nr:HAMP domain-containing histidine kinase [Acidimicrobiia bacterium]NNL13659.1 HAMP domain-containing histidine kinase [Acidimicrobiia bacterium]NNL97900.1 HAMP domain-containing histidine kinase [Acidimicrobiia bacterium]
MADGRLRRAWSAAGVRARTTLVSVVVVGVVFLIGLLVIGDQAEKRLEDSIVSATETRALDVANLAEADALDEGIVTLSATQLIQVIEDGVVIAASPGLGDLPPMAAIEVRPGVTEEVDVAEAVFEAIEERSRFVEDESPYVVLARGYASDDGSGVVLVASSLSPAEAAGNALRTLLWIGFPLALAAVGLTVWFLTGWALRPVDAMRDEADAISAAALARRLPVPESKDEVRRLADTLNLMLERLESAAIRQRRFVSDASHELKTPLATMRTMIEVAESDPEFSDWPGLLTDLKREDERIESLVADLLTLARFDEGAVAGVQEDVDLDQVLGRVAERTARLAPDMTVVVLGIEPARVRGDAAALERLFWNLSLNAARYGTARIELSCRALPDGVAEVRVSDDGPGIAPADRERVFERFVRLDEARGRHEGGTGLGLAVARAIARSHGGDIRVGESPSGALFEVELPLAR